MLLLDEPACAELAQPNEQVSRLEALLLQCEQTDLGTRHFLVKTPFGLTLYGREITVPAGTVITGAAHRAEHLVTVSGDITVSTDDGTKRLTGQHTFTAIAGRKRAGVTHADTVWTTFHVVRADTIDAIEVELTDEFAMLQTKRGAVPFDFSRALEG